jgi:protein-S-isoprenylcysteine O-methyltransferase Ste14
VTTDPATESAAGEHTDPAAQPTATAGDVNLAAPAVPFLQRRAAPRWRIESLFVRLIATSGIIGISVALAAILGTQSVQSWIIGLTVSAVSVVLAAVLWSSRTL